MFTDGHGTMAPITQFFHDLDDLNRIDWPLMSTRYWNDTRDDGDRKRRRQAEFLVHSFFPWFLVDCIAVMKRSQIASLRKLCEANGDSKPINAMTGWYY